MTAAVSLPMLKQTIVAIALRPDGAWLLDQTQLPHAVETVQITTPQEMIDAIQSMIVRGAPAIGIAGAFGIVLSARQHLVAGLSPADFRHSVLQDADDLAQARPTAVNLQWAIDRLKARIQHDWTDLMPEALTREIEREAQAIFDEDLAMCQAIGRHGATVMPKSARILTHCNAGALATAGYGTALGVVRAAFEADPTVQVYADETRPRLQGAKLTVWEMIQEGIPVTLITDSMSAWLMKQGNVDVVVVGADRIAANGDTANKIGTYLLALAAKAHGIPFYVAAPSSTIDKYIASGEEIPIEDRHHHEVGIIHDVAISPEGVQFYNPAFDVTPASLITGIITEKGIFNAPFQLD